VRYCLEVNESQAQIISSSCELLARIGAGQFANVGYYLPKLDDNERRLVISHLDKMRHICDITSDLDQNPATCVAWDIYQVVRHRLAWDSNPKGNPMNVSFDEPLHMSSEPLPTIRQAVSENKEKFIRAVAKFLTASWAKRSLLQEMGDEEAQIWAEIRQSIPIDGRVSFESAENALREFLK
jgi:hypothetical protein